MARNKAKIVLYTFPPVPNSYSISPFAVKTEAFLRTNSIPYETCYTSSFGNNGTIPYLRIFGGDDDGDDSGNDDDDDSFEEISDSNEIIARLLADTRFDTQSNDGNLTREQKAIGHACLRMLEEHTTQTGFYFRYSARNMHEFCEATELRERMFSMADETNGTGNFIFNMFRKKMPKGWETKSKARGFLRYGSPDVVWAMACEDLQALEDLLSPHHDYFFGQSHPGTLDCTVFGHLSQFLYIRMDFPQQKYLNSERCPNLLRFMEQFKQTHFPDWDVLCQKRPNEALNADNPRMKKLAKMKRAAAVGAVVLVAAVVGMGMKLFFREPSGSQEL